MEREYGLQREPGFGQPAANCDLYDIHTGCGQRHGNGDLHGERQQPHDGFGLGEPDGQSGEPVDNVHHAGSIERGLQQQLHGGGLGELGLGSGLHQRGCVHKLRRDLHHDERFRNVLRDREPVGELELHGGVAGDGEHERDSALADDHVQCSTVSSSSQQQLYLVMQHDFRCGGCVQQFR